VAAESYYTQALRMSQRCGGQLVFGEVLMNQHRSKEALPLLENSLAIEPFNPPAHYRLSVLYRELGRGEDARREMAQFQKLRR